MNPDMMKFAAPCDICKELAVFKTKAELNQFYQDPVCREE